MGQILLGGVATTAMVGRAKQNSQECLRALAKRYSINQKAVASWKKCADVVYDRSNAVSEAGR